MRNDMDKVRWGILSPAMIAMKRVIPAMREASNVIVSGIASRDEARAREAAASAGVEKSYGSYEALLADPAIEVVYIPLPNHRHVEWCVKAMQAGKHVLVEKPLSMNAREAEQLLDVRARTGVLIEEAFSIRNHPQWAALRHLIDSGEIGAVRGVQTLMCYNNRNPDDIRNKPKAGGGALYDVGSYTVAGCRMAFGAEPTRALGMFERDPDFGTDRLTSAILDFPAGQATILISTQAGPSTGGSHQHLGLIAEKGWVRMDFPYAHSVPSPCHLFIGGPSSIGSKHAREIAFPPVNQYTLQAERFSALVRGENVPAFPIETSIANMRVLDALYVAAGLKPRGT
jgi:predicted dehydrogenase